jgi:hypothetical protein
VGVDDPRCPDRRHGWLLPVPARIRAGKDDGDVIQASVAVDHGRM